jgi:hypothetical protein
MFANKLTTESKVCRNINTLFRESTILYAAREQAQVYNYI